MEVDEGNKNRDTSDCIEKDPKKLMLLWFKQITQGCGREVCFRESCASNPKFSRPEDQNKAALMALQLVKSNAEPCEETYVPKSLQYSEIQTIFAHPRDSAEYKTGIERIFEVVSNRDSLNMSFCMDQNPKINLPTAEHSFLDLNAIKYFYSMLMEHDLLQRFNDAVGALKTTFDADSLIHPLISVDDLRFLYILSCNEAFNDPTHMETFIKVLEMVHRTPDENKKFFINWFKEFNADQMGAIVIALQSYCTIKIFQNAENDLRYGVGFLDLVAKANSHTRVIHYSEFYNDAVNTEVDLKEDFLHWYHYLRRRAEDPESAKGDALCFCFFPWILNTESKSYMLQSQSRVSMNHNFREAIVQSLTSGTGLYDSPYLVLSIRRDHLIEDTLNGLSRSGLNYKKPLRVKFIGEQGVDEGGVQKELFLLLLRQIFNPEYAMFKYNEQTRLFYFNGDTFESNMKFELLGMLMGLAIYNSIMLDVHFPKAVYKKLLKVEPTFQDLKEFDPELHSGLNKLLEYPGDVEGDLCYSFQVTREVFGEFKLEDLKPNGGAIPVTKANRHEYVDLYVDWFFNKSCEAQFRSFLRGFGEVCDSDAYNFFNHEELELLVCGSKDLDFIALQKTTMYADGYTKDSTIITDFWDIAHQFTQEEKKNFLAFSTGSDRSPIGGLANLELTISRAGVDCDRLPTAHTCFNQLLIPEYGTKEKLKEKLLKAINNSEGFGLI
eukprot:CAMPEP_0115013580 /NCGR_PEP_ID=MMETSP0216-20121206/25504_1 /TAXON_ID=223996 /ORGANISM="Protocruzia adherens, Strain Boccale" /LENGTH=720 /DNA_ID=CAMNT_0002383029 /DNA_START=44 /DNA_END=2206 /DNA_ORIENTATION=+